MATLKEILVRDTPEVLVELDLSEGTPLRTLADEARELLGYSVLADKAEAPTQQKDVPELRLILDSLEIVPYTKESVVEYKDRRKDEVNRVALADFLKSENPHNESYYCHDWRMTKIEEYKLPIPEFVLNKALQVKKAMPNVSIYIEHLTVDPFLVVQTDDKGRNGQWYYTERYWIECWDEPKFEGTL